MNENRLKCHFLLIYGFLGHFLVEKLGCQKLTKSKANPLPKCQFLAKNSHFFEKFFPKKTSPNELKMKGNSLKCHFL